MSEQRRSEPSEAQDVVTMAQMRSLVPRLMELGWDDFFLNPQFLNSLGANTPSPNQVQRLISLQYRYRAESERARGKLMAATLGLYQEMNSDQVSARQIETRVHTLVALQGALIGLRMEYLLRAINVFNHEQHRELARFLDPTFSPVANLKPPASPAPRGECGSFGVPVASFRSARRWTANDAAEEPSLGRRRHWHTLSLATLLRRGGVVGNQHPRACPSAPGNLANHAAPQ